MATDGLRHQVRVATEPAILRFVKRSEAAHHTDEDVALGFWLSRYHLAGEPITSWAPKSGGALAYRALAREVIDRFGK
jgi:hypothetical protein